MRQALALVLRRLPWMAGTLLVLSFVLFGVLSALPGDPVDLLVTSNPNVRPEDVARLKTLRGLDKPWPVQWARWLVGHREAFAPPRPPLLDPVVVELPAEGPARLPPALLDEVFGGAGPRTMASPGVHRFPRVVRDEHGLEALQILEVLVSPTLSEVPTPPEDGPKKLDESERQLGGSTEHALGVGRASETELAAAARRIGPAIAIESVRSVLVDDAGTASLAARALCPEAGVQLEVVQGPGRFLNGVWSHRFAAPGTTVVLFRATALDGRSAEGGFTVEHGPVDDPEHFHRGALFVLLGDTEALGYSSTYKRPVWELLFGPPADVALAAAPLDVRWAAAIQRLGRVQNTMALMIPALLLSLLLAVPLGVVAAARRGGVADRVLLGLSTVGLSMPAFWLGIMAMIVFAARLQWLPAGGIQTPGLSPELGAVLVDRLRHAVLPTTVLALAYAAPWLRYARASVGEVLPQDWVRTARAKGLSPAAVLAHHALRNALLPLITVVALAAPQLFAGALLTETVFSWPGVGRLQYDAILNNDSYVAVVVFLVSAALVMTSNLFADLLYVVVDPRLRRHGRRRGER